MLQGLIERKQVFERLWLLPESAEGRPFPAAAPMRRCAPFLDREVTTLALGLPTSLKVRGLSTKWLLKRVAQRHLPDGLVLRRKRGLSVPIAGWINGGLRDEVDRLLHRERLEAGGLLDAESVSGLLTAHRAGRANHARGLWPLIVFERWKERWTGEVR